MSGKTLKVRVTFTDDKRHRGDAHECGDRGGCGDGCRRCAESGSTVATGEGRDARASWTVSWTAPESNGGVRSDRLQGAVEVGHARPGTGRTTSTRQAAVGRPGSVLSAYDRGSLPTARPTRCGWWRRTRRATVRQPRRTATAQDRLAPDAHGSFGERDGAHPDVLPDAGRGSRRLTAGRVCDLGCEGTARTVDAVALSGSAVDAHARFGGGVGRDGDDGLHRADGRRCHAASRTRRAMPWRRIRGPCGDQRDACGRQQRTRPGCLNYHRHPAGQRGTLTASIDGHRRTRDGLDNAIFAYQWLANPGTAGRRRTEEIADATGVHA